MNVYVYVCIYIYIHINHTLDPTSWKTFGFRTGASLKLEFPNWWHLFKLFELVCPISSQKQNCVRTGFELVPNFSNWCGRPR